MNVTDAIWIAPYIATGAIIWFTVSNHDRLAKFISVRRLGRLERDLPNLKQVVVVANRVEKPSGSLEDAVEDNFRQGVKYLFLVSNSRADQELSGYFLIFEALAKKAIQETGANCELRELVEIKRLTYDWPDVPYIFYQYVTHGKHTQRLTSAFRGNQRGEGIADAYEHLSDVHSLAICSAILAEAPAEITGGLKIVDASDLLRDATAGGRASTMAAS